jgi:plasmid stabilization system protein ParE
VAIIYWTDEAYRWLKDIHDYIVQDNPVSAKNVVEGIFERVEVLSVFPQTGHKFRGEPEGEIRILLYGHYRIAYLVKDDERIDILGVFHGAIEIDRFLP